MFINIVCHNAYAKMCTNTPERKTTNAAIYAMFKRLLNFIINWSLFAAISTLTFILLSDNPTLTIQNYAFTQGHLRWFIGLLMALFTYKERHYIKNEIERFVRWIKAL
ncbi:MULTISPECIES: hypothetical protein [Rodentibacter]|nr:MULTISPECIES: hypothetical protein [Pasteurellaceae]